MPKQPPSFPEQLLGVAIRQFREVHSGDIPLEARLIVLLPTRPALEQMVNLGGDGDDAWHFQDHRAVAVQHVPRPVLELLHDALAEARLKAQIRAEMAGPVEIEAKHRADLAVHVVAVAPVLGIPLGDMTFCGPLVERLVPVTEMDDGHAVVGLVVQDGERAFAVIHGYGSLLRGCKVHHQNNRVTRAQCMIFVGFPALVAHIPFTYFSNHARVLPHASAAASAL